jgi:hypothetical protein
VFASVRRSPTLATDKAKAAPCVPGEATPQGCGSRLLAQRRAQLILRGRGPGWVLEDNMVTWTGRVSYDNVKGTSPEDIWVGDKGCMRRQRLLRYSPIC